MKNQDIEIIPLGGLNKIGSNICFFKTNHCNFAIDAGVRFPDNDAFDVNYTIPSLEIIDRLDYLIITHGHEDHIGGVHKVLEVFPNVKIITTKFNDHLVVEKLKKYNLTASIETIDQDVYFELGKNLIFKFFHVNHSIPFTKGVHFETKDSSVLFISDFKIETHKLHERPFNLKSLEGLGKHKKWRLAMLDSTNIFTEKRSFDELDVFNNLEKIIGTVNKKIFITTFASNIYRIVSVFKICFKFNKKILIKSPSINRSIENGIKYSLLDEKIANKVILKNDYKVPSGTVILLSGSQGETRSALRNLLFNKKPFVQINEGDTFCFSSKIIPGNEKNVFNIYDEIIKKRGVIFNDKDGIHTSGHADQKDLKEVYNHYKPNIAIPIHGTVYFLKKHMEMIEENYKNIKVFNIINFDKIIISQRDIVVKNELVDPSTHYNSYFGKKSLLLDKQKLNERKKMASKGLVSLVVKKYNSHYKFMSVLFQGLPVLEIMEQQIIDILNERKIRLSENLDQTVREIVNKYFEQHLGCRPKTILHIL